MEDTTTWFRERAWALRDAYKNDDPAAHAGVKAVLRTGVGLQRLQHVIAVETGFRTWQAMLDAPEIERRLVIVLAKHPYLNAHGIGLFDGFRSKPLEERRAIQEQDRRKLRGSVNDVVRTGEWLRANIKPIKTINRRHHSYELKHIMERHIDYYVTNGVFIAATLIEGYPVRFNDGPNPCFGMSEKSIKAVRAA